MEETRNMDTPQEQVPQPIPTGTSPEDAFAPPVKDGSINDNLSVEDAFFSRADSENQPAPNTGQPADNQEIPAEQPYEAKNDEKRYEYWQSQAAKRENELKQYQTQQQQLVQQMQQQRQMPTNAPQEAPQEFPPPPPAPEKPQGFSRQEAWDDQNSESARYLDEKDKWSEDMNHYRDLRSQYDIALIRERFEAEDKAKQQRAVRQKQYNQTKSQLQETYNYVTGHYGFSDGDAKEFIQSMSNPESVSMDNLVQLYRMNKGTPPVNAQSQGPSDAFQQSRNAQQVPSPMGVMPAQSTQNTRSDSDTIMDDIITGYKSKNPWGN